MKQVVVGLQLVVVVVVFVTMVELQVASQPTSRNSTLIRFYCSVYQSWSAHYYFLSNLNATLSSLRGQLTSSSYATARSLLNNNPVWGLSVCRGYLSVPDCLDCFDYAVNQLKVCGLVNGGQIIYTDCHLRYENYNFFTEVNSTVYALCSNRTSPQSRQFQKATERLLLDLQIAAPRTTKFYAASTQKVATDNATVYAIAQCDPNVGQSVCFDCLKLTSKTLFKCLPSTYGIAMENQCFMRYDRTPFFGQNQKTNIASLLLDGHSSKKSGSIIGVVVGGVSILLLAVTFFLWRRRWKDTSTGQNEVYYNYRHLELATSNFSQENIIGKGAFGEVFKAILDDKKVVAVKKLRGNYAIAKAGFEKEILLTSQIRHRNLMSLLGWSSEGSNLLLVLEYMQNGSLDKFLWGSEKGNLNWKKRYDIIFGIAKGLAHLHKEFHFKIVHRDIKSSNILLDDHFQPKIADFGLAVFQPEDKSHVTYKFAGTLGYTPPEYVLYGRLSDKVDTFSFGIVILEIVSGRKCTSRNFDASSTNGVLEYAWKLYETKDLMKLVDETMDVNQYKEEHVMNIIEIALLCTQSPASKRPTMPEVVFMLSSDPSFGERQLTRPNFTFNHWRIQIGPS
ncbi:hypothetical protein R6Q59_012234 [Mikania micrantha]